MAYNVSDKYKQVIYSQGEKNKIKILFNGVRLENAGEYCEKFSVKSKLFADDGNKVFRLNDFVAREAELILHNVPLTQIVSPITIQIGTLVGNNPLVESDYEWIPMGIFNIQDNPATDKDKITIKLRNNAVKFDFKYNAEPLLKANGGKATKKQILLDICSKAGVQTTISSFLGDSDLVGISDNTINARTYIAMLAEQAGSIATIDRTGKLIFINLSSLYTWRIPLSIIEKYEIGEPFEIKRVVYESLTKYETSSDETLDTLYLDSSNVYISSQTQVTSIFNKIKNFKIDSVKTGKVLGNPAIDCYDLIQVYDDYHDNKVLFTTLGNNDYTFTGVHRNIFETEISLEQRKENVTLRGEPTFKKWAKAEIDNVNSKVVIEAGRIDEITTPTKTVSDFYVHIEDAVDSEIVELDIDGKSEQSGTPTPTVPIEIKSVGIYNSDTGKYEIEYKTIGKNLFNYTNVYENRNGLKNTLNQDGSVTTIGVPTANYTNIVVNYEITNILKDNETYTLSQFPLQTVKRVYVEVRATKYDGTNNYYSPSISTGYMSFRVDKSIYEKYVISILSNTTTVWGTNSQTITQFYQLERGNKYTGFEKYQEESKIIELKEPLRSIDDIKDTAVIKNNKLIVTRRIGYEKILSTMFVGYYNALTNTREARIAKTRLSNKIKNETKFISNEYKYVTNTWDNDTLGIMAEAGPSKEHIAFRIPVNEDATYFDTHEAYLQYVLETPTVEEYTIDMPHTFKGINNAAILDELKPYFTLTYVRNTAINSYVEGQIIKEQTIRKEQISSLEISNEGIKSDVFQAQNDINNITKTYEGLSQRIDANKATLERQEKSFDSDGNVIAVKVKEGISFDENGLQIYSGSNQFKTHINEQGTVYTDGDNVIGQYTKDGSKQKDLELFGVYRYGKKEINDSAMFVAQLYTNENNEEGFGHFYNGGNL